MKNLRLGLGPKEGGWGKIVCLDNRRRRLNFGESGKGRLNGVLHFSIPSSYWTQR